MSLKDVLEFANQNPACFLATTEGDQPRVRGMLLWFADPTGFYFHTGSTKKMAEQLKKNPRVEVCFFKPSDDRGLSRMLRVCGAAEFLEDAALRQRLLKERTFLNDLSRDHPDSRLVIFRVINGQAHLWTVDDNLREREIPRTDFQGGYAHV